MESSLKYWLWLSTRQGIGTPINRELLDIFDENPERVYFATADVLEKLDLSAKLVESLLDKKMDLVTQIIEKCDKFSYDVITWQDADYPIYLRNIVDPPLVLYLQGRLPRVEEQPTIAMVGSRRCSEYGKYHAREISFGLTKGKAVVVTGMAEGIDVACLQGALKAGGPVISVVAGGMNKPFPPTSRDFYHDVPYVGALLSEYPPDTPHRAFHFPQRNRILSGLSSGVMVVEAEIRGGSMITGRLAREQERDLFVLPGEVNNPNMQGIFKLMHQYQAYPVGRSEHIFRYYQQEFPLLAQQKKENKDYSQRVAPSSNKVELAPVKQKSKREVDGKRKEASTEAPTTTHSQQKVSASPFSEVEQKIVRALGTESRFEEELVTMTQITAQELSVALVSLEIEGAVKPVGNQCYVALVQLVEDEEKTEPNGEK